MSVATDLAEIDAAITENELEAEAADRLRELVQEGAAIADALEQLRQEAEAETAPPPPAAPPEPPVGEPTDQQLKALDRETDRHIKKVHEIMGGFVGGFATCSKCDGLGLEQPGPEPRGHEYFKTCDTCSGFGQVLTGSLREGRNARDCPACGGNGYLEALGEGGVPLAQGGGSPAASPTPLPPAAVALEGQHEQQEPGALTFGRPAWMGDPSIGT